MMPAFVYLKPRSNAKVATVFNEGGTLTALREWMDRMIRMHGGRIIDHDFDEPDFEDDDDGDDELSSVVDDYSDLWNQDGEEEN